ncbi:zinc-dependent metalloprotease [Butyricimonas hominis]|uniref:Zinc-dependent metalloprotease n=1 Tax=Butyricimonas hominis TaxID=2763032 RepID=A0ABR7CZ08_9BACT|nr:zinc-dependent metalloprotease [Butyricimonas hominis]MBC5620901.1 zinc-dependent metalloprotease [Butyricimonas hominis]
MRNKTIYLLVIVLLLPCVGMARKKREDKKAKEDTPYERLFKDKAVETMKGLITIHRVDEKVYFEIPFGVFGREMLLGSTITEITSNLFGSVGEKPFEPLHVVFMQDDSAKVSLRQVNAIHSTSTERYRQRIKESTVPGIIESFEVSAYSPDSTAVVIDVTRFLMSDKEELGPFTPWMPILSMSRDMKMEKQFKNQQSRIGTAKAFDDNFSVQSSLTYEMSVRDNRFYYLYKLPFTVVMTRSFVLLPEEPMRPRFADPRIGIFIGGRYAYDEGEKTRINYHINRWRLEPKDEAAYRRGELVEPVKPIVFHVDNAFPESWKKHVREGVEEWQAAFERIGFKNAIIAVDFPTDDPEFDPDNLKYSCVRYSPSPVANAMGPSWTDPRSGEIIQANISVYHNLIQLVRDWRFLQTSPADPAARKVEMDEEMLGDCIRYVISHEVGHTLGFMHNMAASAAVPTDSLRSPSYTRTYGTTMSIMDYARNNYVAQPGDAERGVRVTPPALGVYDYFLIRWAYTPLLDAKSSREEVPVLDKWISERSGDPVYRYGKQQFYGYLDPSSFEEDLGDDAVKSATYGVKNLKYVLANLHEWTGEDDKDFSFRRNMYNELLYQYIRYMNHVLVNVGGIHVNERYDGDGLPYFSIVPKEKQRRALRFMLEQTRDAGWVDDKDFQARMPIMGTYAQVLQDIALKAIFNRAALVAFGAKYTGEESPYTAEEYFEDIHGFVFAPTREGKELSGAEKKLQMALLSELISGSGVESGKIGGGGNVGISDAYRIAVPREIAEKSRAAYGLVGEFDTEMTRARWLRQAETCPSAKVRGFGWRVELPIMNYPMEPLYLSTLKKTHALLKSKADTGSDANRRHYALLLHKVEQALGQ